MPQSAAEKLYTSGDIAKALGESFARVRWILDTRPIEPVTRYGILRVYDASAIERVRDELARIERQRRGVPA